MRNRGKDKAAILQAALKSPRYEVLPTAKVEAAIIEVVPRDVTITVTASPAKGITATLDLAERLMGHGYSVVPHLAARMISGRSELIEITKRLTTLGVTNVFCPAGDADPPAGEYAGALAMLEHLTELGRPFPEVGITGYPESHPDIEDDITIQSMWDKRAHATYVVSNLCFDPDVVKRVAAADAPSRCRAHGAHRAPRSGRARQTAEHGHQDRRRAVGALPQVPRDHVRENRRPRWIQSGAVPAEVRRLSR